MPTIRIDDEVYNWLQTHASPFEDTPNSVLRRLAGFDLPKIVSNNKYEKEEKTFKKMQPSGKNLNNIWNVGAEHALYHKDGTWFNNLTKFPGALFDPKGYILFKTEKEYRNCQYLNVSQETNVPNGISQIPGYVSKSNE